MLIPSYSISEYCFTPPAVVFAGGLDWGCVFGAMWRTTTSGSVLTLSPPPPTALRASAPEGCVTFVACGRVASAPIGDGEDNEGSTCGRTEVALTTVGATLVEITLGMECRASLTGAPAESAERVKKPNANITTDAIMAAPASAICQSCSREECG